MAAHFITRQQSELAWNTVWDGYNSELERDPDRAAFGYMWELQTGNMTKQQFINALQNSQEYQELHKPPTPIPPDPEPPPVDPIIHQIEISSQFFFHNGELWRWKGVSAFRLFELWITNKSQMEGVLLQLRELNKKDLVLRVFGMYDNSTIGRFVPGDHAAYYGDLRDFAEYLGSHGFRLEFVIFADRQKIMPQNAQATAHAQKVYNALEGLPNVFVEWINEPPLNGDFFAYVNRKGLPSCRGCTLENVIATPVLDYITNHTPRDAEWPRKAKHCYEDTEATGAPCVADEPIGIGDPNNSEHARTDNAYDLNDYFAIASILAHGGTIHSDAGIQCRLLTTSEMELYKACFRPMDTIPMEAMQWDYTRGGFSSLPIEWSDSWGLRAYGRTNGVEAWIVICRPTADFRFQPKAGWTGTEVLPHVYHMQRT